MTAHFLDIVPIWAICLGIVLLCWAAVELGYILGERRQRSTDYVDEGRSAQAGIVLGAMLGLAGFLLAFTYSMAGSQFDSRRQLVIEDVNAIGTAFLRTQPLPEPHRTASRELLREYVSRRDTLFAKALTDELTRAEAIHSELWAAASAVARAAPTPVTALYVQSLNELIDLHGKRVNVETWVRIPDMVFITLALLTLLMMTLTGYLLGLRERRYGFPTVVMIVTYTIVFVLVIDLDRPARGLFHVDQAPMLTLGASIEAEMTAESAASRALE